MKVRAVVSDLDGTLLGPGGRLGEAGERAIRALDRTGIPFLAATGRTLYGIRDTLASVRGAVALGISSSGAIGWHPGRGEILWRRPLERETVERVVEALLRIAPGAGFGAFDGEGWRITESYHAVRGVWPTGPVQVTPASRLAGFPCCALVAADSELDSAALARGLAGAGVGPDVATVTYAGPYILDVVPPGVDKGYGVRRACELLGLDPAEVVAFGDAPNDLPLFEAVGLAVAVANAHPAVLAAADRVAPSNTEEGVASTLVGLGLVACAQEEPQPTGGTG